MNCEANNKPLGIACSTTREATTMSITAHSTPFRKLTFLDLPPETRIMIYQITCSNFTVHVRPRFLTSERQLVEQPTIVTLTNCNILSLSRQIRNEALPYVHISPTLQICRSAIVEIHQSLARRPDDTGHSESTCHFLSHISPTPCDLHQTTNFSLLTTNHAAVAKYFILGFHAIQKTDCKTIAAAWINVVERDFEVSFLDEGHPVAPPWWPDNLAYGPTELLNNDGEFQRTCRSEIQSTEEDADHIHLLTHLLLRAGKDTLVDPPEQSHSSSLASLELSIWRRVNEMQNPNTPEILEEMFKVRQLVERMGVGDSAEKILSGLGI